MPILQAFLKDTLRIKVDGCMDPITVVAKGAAMFGNQTAITEPNKCADLSSCRIEVNYNPVTSENDQTVTGKVFAEASQPYSVQFVRERGHACRSAKP